MDDDKDTDDEDDRDTDDDCEFEAFPLHEAHAERPAIRTVPRTRNSVRHPVMMRAVGDTVVLVGTSV